MHRKVTAVETPNETEGLIQSFVLVGRPYFHKNKKYEFACQLTEAIIKERTMQWKNKICC